MGRALGAKLTDAENLLFVDGNHHVPAETMARFLWECDGRMDVVLNDIAPRLGMFHQRNGIHRIYEFLNVSLNRADLHVNSMAVLPFAISSDAVQRLGVEVLAVPAKRMRWRF